MKKDKLIFCFHNPNTAEATAEHLVSILVRANQKKLEQAIRDASAQMKPAVNT